jgi:hypothetical protein
MPLSRTSTLLRAGFPAEKEKLMKGLNMIRKIYVVESQESMTANNDIVHAQYSGSKKTK